MGKNDRLPKKGICLRDVILIVFAVMVVTAIGTFFLIKYTLFGAPINPVSLSAAEQVIFEQKLDTFNREISKDNLKEFGVKQNVVRDSIKKSDEGGKFEKNEHLTPQAYSEEKLSRTIEFTEREINALIATNTDLATKVAVDLEDQLISVRVRVPMEDDVPILGGKILKIHAGAELAYENGRPIVKIRGVSFMGIPVPNAWLGGIKNIDLVEKHGSSGSEFWQAFAAGVNNIHVSKGKLLLELKE